MIICDLEANVVVIFDRNDGQDLRINTIGAWLKRQFGKKMVKLSVDAGFTCPNRDGIKGIGGCLFCSDAGSGDHASSIACSHFPQSRPDQICSTSTTTSFSGQTDTLGSGIDDCDAMIRSAIEAQIQLLQPKWPDSGYIAYFQSHTNTYGPIDRLRELYETTLEQPGISGIAIATRPDCLSTEVLDLLAELNEKAFMWVELGLQTIHENTMNDMNLCYTLEDYHLAVLELKERGIHVVTHLILGLPGESREMMLESVRQVCRPISLCRGGLSAKDNSSTVDVATSLSGDNLLSGSGCESHLTGGSTVHSAHVSTSSPSRGYIFGLKLHMLNVVRNSSLPDRYPGYVPFQSIDEYTDLVVDALELVPPELTIHRIYADAPKERLIAPTWARQKRLVLNEIYKKLRDRDTWQGRRAE